jgi:hypothetical protein
MARRHPDQPRPGLLIPREEAKQRIAAQIEKAKSVPNASINENHEARRWYDFTAELLRQICTTDDLVDEFTGRSGISYDDDISTGHYLKKLTSIYDRLELYPEQIPTASTTTTDPVRLIEGLINRFHAVTRQLRQRHDNRSTLDISDEYDVQDLFHALLQLYFDDIRPEEWTPSYAGGSSRMDFLLKIQKTVIEVKKTRPKLGAKEVGEQLSVDIPRYRSHPDCRNLICFVYDPEERILNPRGLEQDLSQPVGELNVKVYITQR